VTGEIEDPPRFMVASDSSDIVYLFASNGMCATIPTHQLPQIEQSGSGGSFNDLSPFKNGEVITSVLSLPPHAETGMITFATAMGEVKRLQIADLPGMMSNTFKAMDIDSSDEVGWALVTSGEDEVMLVTAEGQAIRFKENDVRSTTLGTGGMRGIKLGSDDDRVVTALVVRGEGHLFTITNDGVAKSTPLSEYPTQGRAGSGVVNMKVLPEGTKVTAAAIGAMNDQIVLLTNNQRAKTIKIIAAPNGRRDKRGDIVIALTGKEQVSAIVTPQEAPELPTEAAEAVG
jgi:DNA gyrase subunit A